MSESCLSLKRRDGMDGKERPVGQVERNTREKTYGVMTLDIYEFMARRHYLDIPVHCRQANILFALRTQSRREDEKAMEDSSPLQQVFQAYEKGAM